MRWAKGGSADWQENDILMSIGFVEPLNAQMAAGALIADELRESGTVSVGDAMKISVEAVMQAIMDHPAMQQLNSIATGYRYSSGDTIPEKATDAALSYAASQASSFLVPNFVAGIATGMDKTVRNPYNADSMGEKALYNVMADVPILREQVPASLDPLGSERTYGENVLLNMLNANVLPGQLTQYRTDDVSRELARLYEATKGEVSYPLRKAPGRFDVGGSEVKLTADEKDLYQRTQGQASDSLLSELIASADFAAMTDDEKAEAINSLYRGARALAEAAVMESRGEMEFDVVRRGMATEQYGKMTAQEKADYLVRLSAFAEAQDAMPNVKKPSEEAIERAYEAIKDKSPVEKWMLYSAYARDMGISDAEYIAYVEKYGPTFMSSRSDDLAAAVKAGIGIEQWKGYYDKWKRINDDEAKDYSAYDKATDFAQWLDSRPELTTRQRGLLKDQLKFSTGFSVEAERYEALTAAGLGGSTAGKIYDAVDALKPLPGKKDITKAQEYNAILNLRMSPDDTMKALSVYMPESTYAKLKTAVGAGYGLNKFIDFYEKYNSTDAKNAAGVSVSGLKKSRVYEWARANGYTYNEFQYFWKLFT
jgi:hypothetical protein